MTVLAMRIAHRTTEDDVMAQVMGTSELIEASSQPRMNWGAIFAGWFVATGIVGLLYVAGLALGFAAFHPHDVASVTKGIGIGTAVWVVVSWATGLFVGGIFASWFDGNADETMGAMHGIAVWGVSLTATALWVALGLGAALHRDNRGTDMAGTASSMAGASADDAALMLRANVRRLISTAPAGAVEPAVSDAVVGSLLAGRAGTAKGLLLAYTTDSPDAIDLAMSSWSGLVDVAQADLKKQSERAAHHLSMACWITFLSGLLALIAASIGGWLGGRNVHKVYHTRRYPGRPFALE